MCGKIYKGKVDMRIHFIAIGGTVMHDLAIALAGQGHQISGSDNQIVEPSKSKLQDAGLLPEVLGWNSENITSDLDAVIIGVQVKDDNPELLKAQELGLKIYSIQEFIYEQSIEKTRVVIAGRTGKTTIMSMVMHVLNEVGVEFDYLVGSKVKGFDSLVSFSPQNKLILLEGDAFEASCLDERSKFEIYQPNIALITGVHSDFCEKNISEEELFARFERLVKSIVPKGTLIYNKEDKSVSELLDATKDLKLNRHGYNLPSYHIEKGVTYLHTDDANIALRVHGKYYLSYISGAMTVCEWLGVSRADFYSAIETFEGSIRDLEYLGGKDGSVVYRDFSQSLYKIKDSIRIVKDQFEGFNLVTVLQLNDSLIKQLAGTQSIEYFLGKSDEIIMLLPEESLEGEQENENIKSIINLLGNENNVRLAKDINEVMVYLKTIENYQYNLLIISSNEENPLPYSELMGEFFK